MSDCGDWISDNEDRLLEEFVGAHDDQLDLVYGGLDMTINYPGIYKTHWEAIGAWVMQSHEWRKVFDDFCMEAWQSQEEAGPEPDRE